MTDLCGAPDTLIQRDERLIVECAPCLVDAEVACRANIGDPETRQRRGLSGDPADDLHDDSQHHRHRARDHGDLGGGVPCDLPQRTRKVPVRARLAVGDEEGLSRDLGVLGVVGRESVGGEEVRERGVLHVRPVKQIAVVADLHARPLRFDEAHDGRNS